MSDGAAEFLGGKNVGADPIVLRVAIAA